MNGPDAEKKNNIKPFSLEVKEGIELVLKSMSSASSNASPSHSIRLATSDDIPALMRLIHGLAEYEKEPDAVKMTEDVLRRDGFGPERLFYVLLVGAGRKDREEEAVCGMAFLVFMYSTWEGRVLYLEDLFLEEPYRRRGIGTHLFIVLSQICQQLDCSRFEWKALDWNLPAIHFYQQKLGAPMLDPSWRTLRLDREGIKRLAERGGAGEAAAVQNEDGGKKI